MTAPADLSFRTATELAALIRHREVSAVELMEAHLAQIERVNPAVNAIVTLTAESALEGAKAADEALARGDVIGPLHGLPIVHKDLFPTKGVRTTFGSRIFAGNVPDHDALIVERARQAGAISVGKSNTPEFGAGSQTFNEVFGATRNPYDLSKTCGGSSGGAAVALACGLVPLADGSDLGGSLRNPAAFCNLVGLRPSAGRVPTYPTRNGSWTLSVQGPMGRTVEDVALLLSALAGPDPRVAASLAEPGVAFSRALGRNFVGARLAWNPDFGGLPIAADVAALFNQARSVFEALGCEPEDGSPDFDGADEAFKTLRAWSYELNYGHLLAEHGELIKATVIGEIEAGRRLTGPQVARAEALRTAVRQRAVAFLQAREFMVCPTTQVAPFDLHEEWVTQIDGQPMAGYIDWMRACYWISVTGLPAISVPCGFTQKGLPVGLQIVGRPWDDFGVLQLAYAFQQATEHWRRRPDIAQ
ncbi:MAG: amidase [Chloroflexi bacterium]|nr:amidase [Chloroflexota bacterium]